MKPLFTVKAMQERYGCSLPTARKYIRQCNPHMENPLATYEDAVIEWEATRMVVKSFRVIRRGVITDTHVPRRR